MTVLPSKISVIIDVVADGANRSLSSFKKSIQDADGAANKFRAGASGAFDQIKANAGNLALAGGAALIGFGVKAVGAFQDTALAAGELRDSLGLTSEEASRYIEVANDVGVSTESLESSIGRMNVTAGKTPEAFAAIGAELVKNADGTTNVNETFLSTVAALNKIPDATRRAAAAQKIFGKGWKDMAELIGVGADGIRDALDSVEGGKVIDDAEVARARQFRDSLDALRGVGEELAIVVGGALVPALTDAADTLMTVKDAAGAVGDILPDMPGWFDTIADSAGKVINPVGHVVDLIGEVGGESDKAEVSTETFIARMYEMQGASRDLGGTLEDTSDDYIDFARGMQDESQRTADKLTADWDRITGKISEESAYLEAKGQFQELRDAAVTAFEDGEAGAETYRLKQLEVQGAIADYVKGLGNIPPEKLTPIIAAIDRNEFDEAWRLLDAISQPRSVAIRAYTSIPSNSGFRGVGTSGYGGADGNPATPLAEGGIVRARPGGMLARIAEAGHDEAVIPLSGPNAPALGGAVYNFTINDASDPDRVVQAIRQFVRRNGPIQGIT